MWAKGNSIVSNIFNYNGQYGIGENAANADVSAWLNEANLFINNTVIYNSYYGVNFYKQNLQLFNNNSVSYNGYIGIYCFMAAYCQIQNNFIHNNSQAGNGSYDEIMLEGYASNSSHPAANNNVTANNIVIDGAVKSRYAINEGTANDGPNIITQNVIPNAGTSGTINSLCSTDTL